MLRRSLGSELWTTRTMTRRDAAQGHLDAAHYFRFTLEMRGLSVADPKNSATGNMAGSLVPPIGVQSIKLLRDRMQRLIGFLAACICHEHHCKITLRLNPDEGEVFSIRAAMI